MTDSKVEALLKHMTLAEPAAELDSRVSQSLSGGKLQTRIVSQQSTPWKLVSAVAVACLLTGVAVGHATALKNPTIEVTTASAESNLNSTSEDTRSRVTFSHLNAPPIAVFCSLDEDHADSAKEQRCSKCHDGPVDPRPDTRLGPGVAHVHQIHRQLCVKCHADMEDWNARDFDKAIFKAPWHELEKGESPTG